MKKLSLSVLFLLLFFTQKATLAKVYINEIMSSNSTSIMDAYGDYSDWIELYNDGDDIIDLNGYFLSDKVDNIQMWKFPKIQIQANGYIIIWASGKNAIDALGELHTNFKVDNEGETLILSNPNGEIVDSVSVVELMADYTYARIPDGSSTWWVSDQASPGASNELPINYLSAPHFSTPGGFYNKNLNIELSHPDSGVTIVYTLDGSTPSIDDIDGQIYTYKNQYKKTVLNSFGKLIEGTVQSHIYQNPIDVQSIVDRPNKISQISTTYDFNAGYFPNYLVEKCAVIKAVAYKNGKYSDVSTHSYFLEDSNSSTSSIDIISMSTDERNFFDFEEGILVAGIDFDNWRKVDPISQVNARRPANYNRRGIESERTVFIEVFNGQSKEKDFGQLVGSRVQGAVARGYSQKSFKLYSRSEYGNSKLHYKFFEEEDAQAYKRLSLRSIYNRRFSDSYFTNLIHHLDIDKQYNHPYKLFLNGEYYGLYDLKEQLNKHYFNRKYGIDKEEVDIIESYNTLESGSFNQFQELMNYLKSNSLKDSSNYASILNQIDIKNFIDYQIVEIFSGNTDWPNGNVKMWRYNKINNNSENEISPMDGRWRWILYDLDFAFGLMNETPCTYNTLPNAIGDGSNHYHLIFYKLLQNQNFKNQFINRFSDLLNTTFLPSRMKKELNSQFPILEPFVGEHYKRWNMDGDNFANAVQTILDFSECRKDEVFKHLKNQFNIDNQIDITIDIDDKSTKNYIHINTIDINANTVGVDSMPYPWVGTYYHGIPVNITAIATPGYEFSHWENMPEGTPASFTQNFENDVHLIAHFKKLETNTYSLTYTSGKGGFLQGDSIQVVNENEDGTPIAAIPNNGFMFTQWSDGKIENPRTDFNVQNNIDVQAQFDIITGMKNHNLSDIRIFPNPVKSELFIVNFYSNHLSYQIFNTQGQIIKDGNIYQNQGSISLSELPNSLYLIKISDEKNQTRSFKFIKE